MKELNEFVNKIMADMTANGRVEEIIKKNVENAVESSFKKLFESYGTFGKQIEAGLEEAIKIDFSQVSLQEYNLMVVDMVKGVAQKHMKNAAESYLVNELEKVLSPAPKEITVQGILDLYLQEWRDEYSGDEQRATVEIEDSSVTGAKTLKMWKGEKKQSYASREKDPELDLYIRNNGTVGIIRNGRDNLGTCNFGPEAKVYQMYAAGTVVTDIADCDVDDLETWIFDN